MGHLTVTITLRSENRMSNDLTVIPVETPSLGDRSYVVHDGEVAFVVDPQRDIDRVLDLLEEHGVRLLDVFETHIHNDYVTGGLALAERTGASYHVNGEDDVSFDRTPIADGSTVSVGDRMKVRAMSTPGHTFTHLSYALTTADADSDEPYAVFTGGSLLYGATGRPDLLGEEHTDTWPAASTRPPTSWPSSCPTPPRSIRPTASARSARPPRPTRPSPPSARRRSPTPCSPRTRRPTSGSCSTVSARGRRTTST